MGAGSRALIKCGRPRLRRGCFGFGDLVGCGQALFARRMWPLALMEFADRVPIRNARSRCALNYPGLPDPRLDRFVITSSSPSQSCGTGGLFSRLPGDLLGLIDFSALHDGPDNARGPVGERHGDYFGRPSRRPKSSGAASCRARPRTRVPSGTGPDRRAWPRSRWRP
jgi:hypothetical protein